MVGNGGMERATCLDQIPMAYNVPSEGGMFGGRAEHTLRETLLHSGVSPQSSALTPQPPSNPFISGCMR